MSNIIIQALYTKIKTWAKDTFPEAGPKEHILKLKQEADEIIQNPYDVMEYADCLIALYGAASKAGFTLDELTLAIDGKMLINQNRQWIKNEDGTHQHK